MHLGWGDVAAESEMDCGGWPPLSLCRTVSWFNAASSRRKLKSLRIGDRVVAFFVP